MKTTQEYLSDRKIYQRKMSKVKQNLPPNWVQLILNRRKRLSRIKYIKMYNNLVNMLNGRSYRQYLENPELFREINELSTQYKSKNNETSSF